MDRKQEIEFMLKGAEINLLLTCKALCESGIDNDTITRTGIALHNYKVISEALNKLIEETKVEPNGEHCNE